MNKSLATWHKHVHYAHLENKLYSESNPALPPWTPAGLCYFKPQTQTMLLKSLLGTIFLHISSGFLSATSTAPPKTGGQI